MFAEIKRKVSQKLSRCAEKWEKATVVYELRTLIHERATWGDELTVRGAYKEALENPRYFRQLLDRRGKGPEQPLLGTCEILNKPSAAEERYWRKRGKEVPHSTR